MTTKAVTFEATRRRIVHMIRRVDASANWLQASAARREQLLLLKAKSEAACNFVAVHLEAVPGHRQCVESGQGRTSNLNKTPSND